MTPGVPSQHPPQQQQNPNPPDKVMFPIFAPNVRPDDPRLVEIAEHM